MLQELTKIEETLENMREEIVNDHIDISSQMESKVKNVGSILQDLSSLIKEKKREEMMETKHHFETFVKKFQTKEKCMEFENALKEQDEDVNLYFDGTECIKYCGEIIRESETDDGIGNSEQYVLIKILDMFGHPMYKTTHRFKFTVNRVNHHGEECTVHNTIEEAVEMYQKQWEILKKEMEKRSGKYHEKS